MATPYDGLAEVIERIEALDPTLIAERCRLLRRVDHIGEQNSSEASIRRTQRRGPAAGSKLDQRVELPINIDEVGRAMKVTLERDEFRERSDHLVAIARAILGRPANERENQ